MRNLGGRTSLVDIADYAVAVATIVAGAIAIVLLALNRTANPTVANGVIVGLLCLLATSGLLQRYGIARRIERQLDGLLAARECEYIDNLDEIWGVARSMVNAVVPNGFLFDTTSVSNTAEYEHAVEQLAVAGVHVRRIVATSDCSSKMNDFIRLPSGYRNGPVYGNVELRHLPSDLAFDVLITQHGGDISAMIGFKTARSERRYTSALHVFGRHFAREILSIHTSVLWEQAHDPAFQSAKGCDVCGQIMRQAASSLTPHEPDSGRVNG